MIVTPGSRKPCRPISPGRSNWQTRSGGTTRWHSVLARHLLPAELSLSTPLRFLSDGARQAGCALLDLFLPPHCPACDAMVRVPGLLCADCFRQTGFVTEPFCARCGVPFAASGLGGSDQL